MRLRIFGNQRHMRPAQHNRDAALPEVFRQFICTLSRPGNDRHPDEVGLNVERHVLNSLVHQFDIKARRSQCGECGQRERLVPQRPAEDATARGQGRNGKERKPIEQPTRIGASEQFGVFGRGDLAQPIARRRERARIAVVVAAEHIHQTFLDERP